MLRKSKFIFLIILIIHFNQLIIEAQDTIFAKGGTCLYKIRKQWEQCMNEQNERLTYDRDNLEPVYTRAKLTESVNRISCCAYWDFLKCIDAAANKFCPNERLDMIEYSRQLGSAVPSDICQEQFPKNQCERSSYYTASSTSKTSSPLNLILMIVLAIIFN